MTNSPQSGQDGKQGTGAAALKHDGRRDQDLATLLSSLTDDSFIPVEALVAVAEILTYLYAKSDMPGAAESPS